jgi:hypothetical protein
VSIGKEKSVHLEIIEWRRETKRALYLCNAEGFPLSQIDTRFHVGTFHFSAYLKSDYVTELHNEERLGVAELEPKLQATAEEARLKIKEYFRERAAAQARLVVDEWKAEQVYPFKGEATTPIERAERQVFDIVAVSVQNYTPDFHQRKIGPILFGNAPSGTMQGPRYTTYEKLLKAKTVSDLVGST